MTKEEQDALIFISATNRTLHSGRVKENNQTVFRVMTFFALCVAAKYAPNVSFPTDPIFRYIVWTFFLALAMFSLWEFRTSGKANEWNHEAAKSAENTIMKALERKEFFIKPASIQPRKSAWLWRSLICILSAVAAAYIITK